MRRGRFIATLILLALLASTLRIWELSGRLLHSDEGVNHFFITEVLKSGIYRYSHENYHGPLYFYLSAGLSFLLGDTPAGLRAGAVLSGLILVFTPFLFRPYLSTRFALLAGFLLAVSPSQVFYSRYAIHESLLVMLTSVLGAAVFRLMRGGSGANLYLAAVAAALLIAVKETFVIVFASLAIGSLIACTGREKNFSKGLILKSPLHLLSSALLAICIVLIIFSAGFRRREGVAELLAAVPQWIGRSASGEHSKPFGYYICELIAPIEPYLFLGPLLLGIIFVKRPAVKRSVTKDGKLFSDLGAEGYFAGWTLGSVLIYSALNYKTPWLIINLTLPATLLLAAGIDRLWSTQARVVPFLQLVTYCAALTGLYQTVRMNYRTFPLSSYATHSERAYTEQNPFYYVHTGAGLLSLLAEVETYRRDNPSARVLVAFEEYWPIPFYFRGFKEHVHYINGAATLADYQVEYEVMIGEPFHQLPSEIWSRKVFELRPNKAVALFTKKTKF